MRQWTMYLLLLSASVSADPAQWNNNLTLDQVIINVLEKNPTLNAAGFESKAAAARIRAERMSPALKTSLELENFAGSGVMGGTDNIESTLRLSRVIELGDKAELRGKVAHQQALLLRNEQDARRLDLLAEATRRYIHVVTDQQRLIIAKESLAIAEKIQQVARRRVAAGKSAEAELRRVTITVARKKLEVDHAIHELASSRLKLSIMWAEVKPAFNEATAELFKTGPVTSFEELSRRLEHNPDLLRYATEQRLSYSRQQLIESDGQPDIEISGGLRHFNTTDDTGLVMSLNFPLGSKSRAAPRKQEVELMRLKEPFLYEERKLELYATLFEVYQESQHARDALSSLRETIIPQAAKALKDYEKGYAAGRYSFLELTEAQNTLIESRLEAVMRAADYHRYQIEIDRLTGAGLVNSMSADQISGVKQ